MPTIKITGFAGANSRTPKRSLPDAVGVDSRNHNPSRGDLRPWHVPLTVTTVPASRKTIYRMGRDVANDALYWLSWTTVVHAVRGFIASDSTERTYFTGSGTPKVTDNIIGLASSPYPAAARELGVPAPSTPLTLTQNTPGTGTDELRFYVQTFVTDKGEESAPSAVASITVKPGAIIDITGLAAAPAGNYGITLRRIYRTVAGASGTADFFFLREIASSATTTQDDARAVGADTLVTNGPDGESGRAWGVPPTDLKGLTVMWNGMMAGISGRSVRYSEPYKPYAWPVAYETLTGDVTPVALGVWSKNLLILTTGRPYLVNGSSPEALGDDPIEFDQACVSDRSVVDLGHGVAWASPDGLCYFGKYGEKVLTGPLIHRDDWLAIKPETIVGCQYEGAYMGFYEPSSGVLRGFVVDPINPQGIYWIDLGYSSAFFDKLQDALYVLDGTDVKKWDAGVSFMTATFTSKTFRMPRPLNMAAMEVTSDAFPVTVEVYADGSLSETRTITSIKPVSLKSGFMATDWHVKITNANAGGVQGVALSTSMLELGQT